jgi:formate hydrogenlyase transcriptional activator
MSSNTQPATYPSVVERYCALLNVSEAIICNRDLGELFHDLAGRLSPIVSFDYISVLLHDAEHDVMRLHLWESPGERSLRPGWSTSVEGSAAGWVWQTQQLLIVHDIDQEQRFPLTTDVLREQGIKSFYAFPLTPAGQRLGAMGFGCKELNGCSDETLEFMQQVVKQVAVAVDNALNFESAADARQELAGERDRLRLLLEINNAVVSILDLRELLTAIATALRRVMPHEFISLSLYDPESEQLRVHALNFVEGKGLVREGISMPVGDAPAGLALCLQ